MTDATIRVRKAVTDDVNVLVPLFDAYRCFYGAQSDPERGREFLLARLRHAESTVFIAERGTQPAGFAQLFPTFSSVAMAHTFILNDLFVVAEHRRARVAHALIDAAVEFCEQRGAVRLSLSTAVNNGAAQALYESMGWSKQLDFDVYVRTL